MKIVYLTTNIDKYHKAQVNLAPYGIELDQIAVELEEPQSLSGEEIVLHKANQAFQKVHQPVLVSDDSWSIPALNGFPATSMKLCNHFLTAEDWLRLMAGIKDRRINLIPYLAFHDGTQPKVISYVQEAYFLEQPQGFHAKAPHLMVIAWKNQSKSVAELISEGIKANEKLKETWQQVAGWITASQFKAQAD